MQPTTAYVSLKTLDPLIPWQYMSPSNDEWRPFLTSLQECCFRSCSFWTIRTLNTGVKLFSWLEKLCHIFLCWPVQDSSEDCHHDDTRFEWIPALMPVHRYLHAAFLCIHPMEIIRLYRQWGHVQKVEKKEGSWL